MSQICQEGEKYVLYKKLCYVEKIIEILGLITIYMHVFAVEYESDGPVERLDSSL